MRRQLRQRRQWLPTACGSGSARRRNNAFGQGRTSPARRTASNAWTHVVSPRGRIGVRTAPKRLRKVSKRGSAKDAAVERREASAQRLGAERLQSVPAGSVIARQAAWPTHPRLSARPPPFFNRAHFWRAAAKRWLRRLFDR